MYRYLKKIIFQHFFKELFYTFSHFYCSIYKIKFVDRPNERVPFSTNHELECVLFYKKKWTWTWTNYDEFLHRCIMELSMMFVLFRYINIANGQYYYYFNLPTDSDVYFLLLLMGQNIINIVYKSIDAEEATPLYSSNNLTTINLYNI